MCELSFFPEWVYFRLFHKNSANKRNFVYYAYLFGQERSFNEREREREREREKEIIFKKND